MGGGSGPAPPPCARLDERTVAHRSTGVPALRLPGVVAALKVCDEAFWVLDVRRNRTRSMVARIEKFLVIFRQLGAKLCRGPYPLGHADMITLAGSLR